MNKMVGKYIGLDYGTKQVGVATSDAEGRLAFPYGIYTPKIALKTLVAISCKEVISGIIIGTPETDQGETSSIERKIYDFAIVIRQLTGLPVALQSEHYSTFEARRPLKKRRGNIARQNRYETHAHERADARAAAVILQRYLDKNSLHKN